jgi:hypothetical protein
VYGHGVEAGTVRMEPSARFGKRTYSELARHRDCDILSLMDRRQSGAAKTG